MEARWMDCDMASWFSLDLCVLPLTKALRELLKRSRTPCVGVVGELFPRLKGVSELRYSWSVGSPLWANWQFGFLLVLNGFSPTVLSAVLLLVGSFSLLERAVLVGSKPYNRFSEV